MKSQMIRVRIDLMNRARKLADTVRPRSTQQAVIEAALEDWLKEREKQLGLTGEGTNGNGNNHNGSAAA